MTAVDPTLIAEPPAPTAPRARASGCRSSVRCGCATSASCSAVRRSRSSATSSTSSRWPGSRSSSPAPGLALGTVLMVAGVPRAVFMLVGGAFSDRFSPRTLDADQQRDPGRRGRCPGGHGARRRRAAVAPLCAGRDLRHRRRVLLPGHDLDPADDRRGAAPARRQRAHGGDAAAHRARRSGPRRPPRPARVDRSGVRDRRHQLRGRHRRPCRRPRRAADGERRAHGRHRRRAGRYRLHLVGPGDPLADPPHRRLQRCLRRTDQRRPAVARRVPLPCRRRAPTGS